MDFKEDTINVRIGPPDKVIIPSRNRVCPTRYFPNGVFRTRSQEGVEVVEEV